MKIAIKDKELEKTNGGTIIKLDGFEKPIVFEISCPKCGSKNVSGFLDGQVFTETLAFDQAQRKTTLECNNCGHSDTARKFKTVMVKK